MWRNAYGLSVTGVIYCFIMLAMHAWVLWGIKEVCIYTYLKYFLILLFITTGYFFGYVDELSSKIITPLLISKAVVSTSNVKHFVILKQR